MVVLLHNVHFNMLERIVLGTTGKNTDFFIKISFFKPKVYLALSTKFSGIQMLPSQPSSLKELINLIAVIRKP